MNMKKYPRFMFIYGAIGVIFGMILKMIIQQDYNLSTILGALTAAVILCGVDILRIWLTKNKTKDKTPDFDERTINNILKFYAYVSALFIGLLLILLSIVSYLNIESVSVIYLWLFIILYLNISGIGVLIVSKK